MPRSKHIRLPIQRLIQSEVLLCQVSLYLWVRIREMKKQEEMGKVREQE